MRRAISLSAILIAHSLMGEWQICYDLLEGINVPVLPENGCDIFYAEVDYLLWYGTQNGLSYAAVADVTSGPTSSTAPTTTNVDESDKFLKNNWNSGFRAALGYKPACFSWDIRSAYTYFNTCSSPKELAGTFVQGENSAVGGLVFSEFYSNIISNLPSTTTYTNKTHWKLDFNQLDIELGREFLVACDIALRPFLGVRGLQTQQKIAMSVVQPFITSGGGGSLFGSSNSDFNGKNQFTGIGIKSGLDLSFTLGAGFELCGGFTGSLLWGRFNVNEFQNQVITLGPIVSADILNDSLHRKFDATVLNFDLFLGMRWNYWFSEGCKLLSIKAGWEQHYFTEMNQFQNPNAQAVSNQTIVTNPPASTLEVHHNFQRGALSLQGCVFGLSLWF